MQRNYKAIFIIIVSIIAYFQIPDVSASLSIKKPAIMENSTADLQDANKSLKTIIGYGLYVVYSASIVTLLAGLVMLLRGLGNPTTGWAMIKSGAMVGIAGGLFHVIVGIFTEVAG